MANPLYYSAREAAALLGVSADTIRAMCTRGDFPGARRIGTGQMAPWKIPSHLSVFHPDLPEEQPAQPKKPSIMQLIERDIREFRRTGVPVNIIR